MLYEVYVALSIITLLLDVYTLVYFITRDRDKRFFMLLFASFALNIFAAAGSSGVEKVLSTGQIIYINQNAMMYVFGAFAVLDVVLMFYHVLVRYVFDAIDAL